MAKAALPYLKPNSALLTLSYLGAVRAVPNYNTMGLAKASLEAGVRFLAQSLGAPDLTRLFLGALGLAAAHVLVNVLNELADEDVFALVLVDKVRGNRELLDRVAANPFAPPREASPLRRQWAIWRWARSR